MSIKQGTTIRNTRSGLDGKVLEIVEGRFSTWVTIERVDTKAIEHWPVSVVEILAS